MIAHALHDHVVHFYHLSALDWVDVTKALDADPVKASQLAESLSSWPGNSKHQLAAVKEKLKGFVAAGQLGIFQNGYWGHPAMKLSPEVNLLAVAHYLQALEVQRKANQAVAILGGKTPNIQNLAVGGVANAINLDSPAALNMEKLYQVKTLLDEVSQFVYQAYVPDVCAIGAMYADWTQVRRRRDELPRRPRPAARREGDAVRAARRHHHERRHRHDPADQVVHRIRTSRTTSPSRSRARTTRATGRSTRTPRTPSPRTAPGTRTGSTPG